MTGIRERQTVLLAALECFDRLCREHSIIYSAHGGLLLGATREGGFIPWDDDLDVSMMRCEYEKLLSALDTADSSLALLNNISFHPVLAYQNCEDGEPVWIDVFVWDFISERKLFAALKILCMRLWIGICKRDETMALTTKIGTYSGWRLIVMRILFYIGSLIPFDRRISWSNSFAKKMFNGDKTRIHRSHDSYQSIALIVDSSCLSAVEDVAFEDMVIMRAVGFRDILVTSYGADYMIPKKPDEESIDNHIALDRMLRAELNRRYRLDPKLNAS